MIIKELRSTYGLTQKQFSLLTGVPVRTLQDWENGRRNPPEYVTTLLKFYLDKKIKKRVKK